MSAPRSTALGATDLVPGSSLSEPRWLSAEGLLAEQRERMLRRRIHRALSRGTGTVWGLAAVACEPGSIRLRTRVVVRPGVAVDADGHEIYVDREQCLDVANLVRHPIWGEMSPPDGAMSQTARRAYIVLRNAPGLSGAYPASSGAVFPSWHALSGAAADFRLELSSVAPPSSSWLSIDSLSAICAPSCGRLPDSPLFALAVADGGEPSGIEEAPSPSLLLATLDLDITGYGTSAIAYAIAGTAARPNPDNRARSLVPSVRRVAEVLFGEKLPLRRSPTSRRGVATAPG